MQSGLWGLRQTGPGGIGCARTGYSVIIHAECGGGFYQYAVISVCLKTVCQAFPNTFAAQDKSPDQGNPVRKEITEILNPSWRYQEREKLVYLRVLIVGGSLGAQALNERVPEALKQLNVPLSVYHQCGQNHADTTQARYADALNSFRLKFTLY